MPAELIEGRTEHLLACCDNLVTVHREWVESDTSHLDEHSELFRSIEEVIEVFSEGSIPAACRKLEVITTRELAPAWQRWKDGLSAQSAASARNPVASLPGNGVWKAIESIESATKAASEPEEITVESIPELVAQKVSPKQICRIYGWLNPDGSPQFRKLEEEIREPGKHTANFVPPARRQQLEAQQRQEAIAARIREKRDQKIKYATEPAPESTADLIRQGLSATQIARMKKITVDEVYRVADEQGLSKPQLRYKDSRTERAPQEPGINPEAEKALDSYSRNGAKKPVPVSGDDLDADLDADLDDGTDEPAGPSGIAGALSLDQEIAMHHKRGMRPTDIAAAVSSPEAPVSRQRVNAAIKRYTEDPDSFGLPESVPEPAAEQAEYDDEADDNPNGL